MGKYFTILADPPWAMKMTGSYLLSRHMRPAKLVYPTMPTEQIKAMPIGELAADGAHLWLWVTNQFIDDGFDVMKAWGFKYLSIITWKKPSGLGNYFINHTEHMLFGYKNKCIFPKARYIPNAYEASSEPVDLWNEWGQATRHSAKPAESYRLVESISESPRLEVFARPVSPLFPKVEGWDVFGNEVASDVAIET